jgi:hypothetical protein
MRQAEREKSGGYVACSNLLTTCKRLRASNYNLLPTWLDSYFIQVHVYTWQVNWRRPPAQLTCLSTCIMQTLLKDQLRITTIIFLIYALWYASSQPKTILTQDRMMMEAVRTSEMSTYFYETTRRCPRKLTFSGLKLFRQQILNLSTTMIN